MPLSAVPPTESSSKPAQPNHVNFVLLGHQRCGSNLLLRALLDHPEVRMAGEVLAPVAEARKVGWEHVNLRSWEQPRGPGYQDGEDGARFLKDKIFANEQIWNSRAFGFKFFFDHAHFHPAAESAWDFLFAQKEIRIVHLVRRNLLYALISREVATRTRKWHQNADAKHEAMPALAPFAIDPVAARAYFDRITEARRTTLQSLAGHPLLTIEYEADLCEDFRATTFRLFDFLGVIRWYSKPGLAKQQKLTAPEQVSNFNELLRHFKDTPYAEFFSSAESPTALRAARI